MTTRIRDVDQEGTEDKDMYLYKMGGQSSSSMLVLLPILLLLLCRCKLDV